MWVIEYLIKFSSGYSWCRAQDLYVSDKITWAIPTLTFKDPSLKAVFRLSEERWIVPNAFWHIEDAMLCLERAKAHDASLNLERVVRFHNPVTHEVIPTEILCG